jgi:hypothetical protein
VRRTSLIPLFALLAVLTLSAPAAARDPIAIGIANPDANGLTALDDHINLIGQTPRLWALWSDWGSRGGAKDCIPGQGSCAFPTEKVIELQNRGVTPVLWWQPTNPANPLQGYYERYQRTINGFHDPYITQWALDARAAGEATGKPIVLRYAHEATGYWFPWSIGRFDNTKENYKAAWKHVWTIFKREGALPYVRFSWSTVFPYKWAYPGDKYVKFVGITVLNFGEHPKVRGGVRAWREPEPLIRKRVEAAAKFTKRPIIIAEMATGYEGGDKALWLKKAYKVSYERFPKIRGIMYLDTDQPATSGGQPDWRLIKPDDGSALNMYRTIASWAKFQGSLFQ